MRKKLLVLLILLGCSCATTNSTDIKKKCVYKMRSKEVYQTCLRGCRDFVIKKYQNRKAAPNEPIPGTAVVFCNNACRHFVVEKSIDCLLGVSI